MPLAQDVGKIIARGIGPVATIVTPQVAGGALRRVLELAIDGYGRLPGAKAHRGPAAPAARRVGRRRHRLASSTSTSGWPRPRAS